MALADRAGVQLSGDSVRRLDSLGLDYQLSDPLAPNLKFSSQLRRGSPGTMLGEQGELLLLRPLNHSASVVPWQPSR